MPLLALLDILGRVALEAAHMDAEVTAES